MTAVAPSPAPGCSGGTQPPDGGGGHAGGAGSIDIFVFGLLGHKGEAAFAYSIGAPSSRSRCCASMARPARAYGLGIASVVIGVARGLVAAKRA